MIRRIRGFLGLLTVFAICVLWWIYGSIQIHKVREENYREQYIQEDDTPWESLYRNTTFPPVPTALGVNSTYDIGKKSLRILFWTDWIPRAPYWFQLGPKTGMVECGGVTCQYTNNRSLYDVSHGILFYFNRRRLGESLIPMIYPYTRDPKQYWIAHYQDNPGNQHFKSLASFNNLFNLSSNYHSKSDVQTPYGVCQKSSKGETLLENYSEGKTGLVSWIVSHCHTNSRRERYVRILKKYINITIHGQCRKHGSLGKLCGGKNIKKMNCDDARSIMNAHKFYLSFENTICTDYASEKLFKVMQTNMRTVPVVRNGVENLKDILPPHSYIDTREFDSPKELAEYLQLLDSNDELYNEYFAWRSQYTCELGWVPCTLCRSFHKVYGRQGTLFKDTTEIFSYTKNCEASPTDIGLEEITTESYTNITQAGFS